LAKDGRAELRRREIEAAVALGDEARQQQRDAAAEWKRVVPVLDRMGLLATVDGALLTDYCACWARLLQCERALAREGLIVQGQKGVVRNPHTTVAVGYRTALRGYIGELGLGPSSRGRLALPGGIGAEEESPWDA
jgi:P27 family predicted phage terminase small subunit